MWRLRSEIYTEVVIEPEKIENANIIIKVSTFSDLLSENGNSIPANFRLCDIYLKNEENDLLEAFSILYNELNCFIDRLSFVSYCQASLQNIISISPDIVKLGEIFEIAVPQANQIRKTNNILLSKLNYDKPLNPQYRRLERLMRLGLNSFSEEEKYLSYYSLLEEIANNESTEYIETTCNKCGHVTSTGRKKTGNFIKNLLEQHGLDSKMRKEAESIRNKIAHGGAEKNKEYFSNVVKISSHLEEICLIEIESRFEIDIVNRLSNHIIDIPMFKHSCMALSNHDFEFISSTLTVNSRFVKLKHSDEAKFENQSSSVGVSYNQRPNLSEIAFPDILMPFSKEEEIVVYQNIGETYYKYDEQLKAKTFYFKSLNIAEELDNKEAIACGNANIGNTYRQLNNIIEAKKHWTKSFEIFHEIESPMATTVKKWLNEN